MNWIESNRELITSIFKFKEFTYNNPHLIARLLLLVELNFNYIGAKTANKQKNDREQIIFYTKEIEYFKKKLTN